MYNIELKRKLTFEDVVQRLDDKTKIDLPFRVKHLRDSLAFTQMDGLGLQELEAQQQKIYRERARTEMLEGIAKQSGLQLRQLEGIFRYFAEEPVPEVIDPTFQERQRQTVMEAEFAREMHERAQAEDRARMQAEVSERHAASSHRNFQEAAANSRSESELAANLAEALRQSQSRLGAEQAQAERAEQATEQATEQAAAAPRETTIEEALGSVHSKRAKRKVSEHNISTPRMKPSNPAVRRVKKADKNAPPEQEAASMTVDEPAKMDYGPVQKQRLRSLSQKGRSAAASSSGGRGGQPAQVNFGSGGTGAS